MNFPRGGVPQGRKKRKRTKKKQKKLFLLTGADARVLPHRRARIVAKKNKKKSEWR